MQSSLDPRLTRLELLRLLERLHRHKDAAYGDAWRKRGEVIAIFANLARKYDRLLVAFEEDRPAATESLGDTVADLCVYTAKYLTWIADEHPEAIADARLPVEPKAISARRGPVAVNAVFEALGDQASSDAVSARAAWPQVQSLFDRLDIALMAQVTPGAAADDKLMDYSEKAILVWNMLRELSRLLVALELEGRAILRNLRGELSRMDRATVR